MMISKAMFNNRKTICLTVCLLMAFVAIAQTQQGIVKTRGRMVNEQLIPGKGIPNAIVAVRGRSTILSQTNGSFSFPIPAHTFSLDSVSKNGYQLVDADALTKPYKYSDNPLCLVMETPEQQLSDLLAAQDKIRRSLEQQLHQKKNEIEALKVTQAVKDSLLRVLYQQQGDNEKLISDMANRYATLDYDQLDDFYRQVSYFIENGELTRADSLLRTRGDLCVQVRNILKQGQAIQEEEEHLQKAKEVQQADIEEAARRSYGYFETFLAQHQNDSAAYYLELRAALDTTNLQWQNEAGKFIDEYLANYPKALDYYQRVLRQSIGEEGNESPWTAIANSNIGLIYSCLGDYSKALEYFDKALLVQEKIFGSNHPDMAIFYNNIGAAYYYQTNYEMALDYFNQALSIQEKVFGTEHSQVATSYNNIGFMYCCQKDYHKALEYYGKSLAIRETLFGTEHLEVAESYNNIGGLYCNLGDYSKALEYYNKALLIEKKILGREHPKVANSYNNIGVIYSRQGDYSNALEYYNKAMNIDFRVFGPDHPNVAFSYCNIGNVKVKQGHYQEALENYGKALDIQEKFYGAEHPNTLQVKSKIKEVQSKITE